MNKKRKEAQEVSAFHALLARNWQFLKCSHYRQNPSFIKLIFPQAILFD